MKGSNGKSWLNQPDSSWNHKDARLRIPMLSVLLFPFLLLILAGCKREYNTCDYSYSSDDSSDSCDDLTDPFDGFPDFSHMYFSRFVDYKCYILSDETPCEAFKRVSNIRIVLFLDKPYFFNYSTRIEDELSEEAAIASKPNSLLFIAPSNTFWSLIKNITHRFPSAKAAWFYCWYADRKMAAFLLPLWIDNRSTDDFGGHILMPGQDNKNFAVLSSRGSEDFSNIEDVFKVEDKWSINGKVSFRVVPSSETKLKDILRIIELVYIHDTSRLEVAGLFKND